ncbi:MAG: hypothetical protein OQL18_11715, partial [Deltaproteobacteria bacterium]|nr:hypothetical protein [Deltaproteobacteria bacterium]
MKKLLFVIILCSFATGALAETKGFQLSLMPDIAIQPRTTQIEGIILGLWNENPQNALALGFVNGSTGDSSGLSLSLIANYSESYKGAQLAYLVNYAKGELKGLQWAAFNYAARLHGLQLGFINYAEASDKGVQIGLFNIMN